jgi:hypothetical protein
MPLAAAKRLDQACRLVEIAPPDIRAQLGKIGQLLRSAGQQDQILGRHPSEQLATASRPYWPEAPVMMIFMKRPPVRQFTTPRPLRQHTDPRR